MKQTRQSMVQWKFSMILVELWHSKRLHLLTEWALPNHFLLCFLFVRSFLFRSCRSFLCRAASCSCCFCFCFDVFELTLWPLIAFSMLVMNSRRTVPIFTCGPFFKFSFEMHPARWLTRFSTGWCPSVLLRAIFTFWRQWAASLVFAFTFAFSFSFGVDEALDFSYHSGFLVSACSQGKSWPNHANSHSSSAFFLQEFSNHNYANMN